MKSSNEVFLRMLRGEATTAEYVEAVKREVEQRRRQLRRRKPRKHGGSGV